MENDTEDPQSERQVEEVSSFGGGAVIEMQEFPDIDDSTYEVPIPPSSSVMGSANLSAPVSFVSAPTNNDTVHPVSTVVLLEQQQGAFGGNDYTLSKSVPADFDPYPNISAKGWLPPIMNIAPGSISIPLKEKIPSKFIEGGWVLHQGMQTEKIIKRVIHRHVQTASTKKKLVRHIHVQTSMPATRRFRHACNQKCLVDHTERFHVTHNCKKQLVKMLSAQA